MPEVLHDELLAAEYSVASSHCAPRCCARHLEAVFVILDECSSWVCHTVFVTVSQKQQLGVFCHGDGMEIPSLCSSACGLRLFGPFVVGPVSLPGNLYNPT
jgi:hypothetical protein